MNRSEKIVQDVKTLIHKTNTFLFNTRLWKLGLILFFLSIVQNGIWYSPQTERLIIISQDIYSNPFHDQPLAQWLIPSFLGPVIGNFFNLNQSVWAYSVLHFLILLIGSSILGMFIKQKYGDFAIRSLIIIIYISPISNVLVTWLGSPDVLTFILSIALVISLNNILLISSAAFLMGINHPEQGIIILFLVTIFLSYSHSVKKATQFLIISTTSFFLGWLLIDWHFNINNFEIQFNRINYLLGIGLGKFIKIFFTNFLGVLFSFYNMLIIFVVLNIIFFWKNNNVVKGFVLYNLLAIIPTFFSLDQTRVFSILTLPAVILLVLSPQYVHLKNDGKLFFKNILSISFLFGLILPRIIVWEGKIYSSAYGNIVTYLQEIIKN